MAKAWKDNPWETGGECGGVPTVYVDTGSRMDAVKRMDGKERLVACYEWPDTQKSVKARIKSRYRALGFGDIDKRGTAIIVRELVDADQVLPPAKEPTLPYTPAALAEQYGRAMAGLRECIRFGAMLVEIEASLCSQTSHNRGNQHTGAIGNSGTLKAWLKVNCPRVSYGWAMKYKRLAEGLRERFNVSAKVPLSLAIPAADADAATIVPGDVPQQKLAQVNKKVAKFLDGKTAWQLEFEFGLRGPKKPEQGEGDDEDGGGEPKRLGGRREGAGRKPLTLTETAAAIGADPIIARERLVGLIDGLRRAALDDDAFGALPDREIEALVLSVSDVVRRGREILAGRRSAKPKSAKSV